MTDAQAREQAAAMLAGKEETFRCRRSTVHLHVEGKDELDIFTDRRITR